jgi:hypothetical protein
MQISILNKKELEAHDTYLSALSLLSRLGEKSLEKVLERFRMLHLTIHVEDQMLRSQLKRISEPSEPKNGC